jgi:hypothetical protein
MIVPSKNLSCKAAGFPLMGTAALFMMLTGSSCRSVSNPDNAPAYGSLGGLAAGALIGSISGNAGTGAFVGGLVGQSTGEIIRSERSPARAAHDGMLLDDLPGTLRAASRFDGNLAKEHGKLARKRATSPSEGILLVKAEAKAKIPEIQSWIDRMTICDEALGRAISEATAYPSNHLGTWLNQRNQVRARLDSLRMHLSWFQSLAS